jgi:hypothetical protein
MTPKLKSALIIAAKNAVNAIITNAGLITMLHGAFNVSSAAGWWNIGKATISVVAAREAIIWGPKLLAWSSSSSVPPADSTGQ